MILTSFFSGFCGHWPQEEKMRKALVIIVMSIILMLLCSACKFQTPDTSSIEEMVEQNISIDLYQGGGDEDYSYYVWINGKMGIFQTSEEELYLMALEECEENGFEIIDISINGPSYNNNTPDFFITYKIQE